MKKAIRLVAAALTIMLLFSSCEFSVNSAQTEDSTDKSSETSSSESTSVNVPLPVFADASSSGRGLKTMPVDYFEGDHYLACAVMTLMPTMTNLEAVEINISGTSLENIKTSFTAFGFDIELVADSSHINKDGVYLQYKVLYEGTNVGFCDYYYNIEKKTFSYRQSVICTFEKIAGMEVYDNEILNMEYIDIPVENPLKPVFKVGQMTEAGTLGDDAFVDNIWLNTPIPDLEAKLKYMRAFITLNEVKGDDGLYTMYAFKQPDIAYKMDAVEYKGEFEPFKTVLEKYLDEDLFINTDEERNRADFELMKEIYPLVYKNGQSIADHHSTVKGYTSYDDFVANSFREQTDLIESKIESYIYKLSPVIYTYNGKNSTGATVTVIKSLYGSSGEYSDNEYTRLGFNDYFGEYDSKKDTVTISDFIVEKFLKACGIDNETYINKIVAQQ